MLKVLSLFSGIGAFEKALDNQGVNFELVNFCEFDKYAARSYCAIHQVDESKNLGDITKVDETKLDKDLDILTYGFPCQDISLAGKQKGLFNEDGTQTRSGLFFEALRIIEATKPKIAIAENVKNLTSKKFNAQFQVVLASLDTAGYNNYYKVLNAKDYGVPQNRERVFIVSIRKDIDTGKFEFPEGFELKKRLKDVLEDTVDEKYYLKGLGDFFIKNSFDMEAKGNGFRFEPHIRKNAGVAKTITTNAGSRMDDNFVLDVDLNTNTFKFDSKNPQLKQIGQMYPNSGNPQAGRIYDADGISPTMDTCSGGNRMPKVAVGMRGRLDDQGKWQQQAEVSDREYANAITTVQKDSLVGEPMAYDEQNRYIRKDGCVGTIMTDGSSPKKNNRVIQGDLRIRKLTPKECFRLMGFDDESFHRAEAVNSNTQLYKQAGNSIVVDVLEELFCMMLDEDGYLYV